MSPAPATSREILIATIADLLDGVRTVAVGATVSPRDINQLPSAPVTTASTTSLMSQS